MTIDLVAFLRARLDERAEIAEQARQWDSRWPAPVPELGSPWRQARTITEQNGPPAMVVKLFEGREMPEDVLADIAAKRAIIDELDAHEQRTAGRDEMVDETGWRLGVELAAQHLVAVYDGHPDFDPAWRVSPLAEADYL